MLNIHNYENNKDLNTEKKTIIESDSNGVKSNEKNQTNKFKDKKIGKFFKRKS